MLSMLKLVTELSTASRLLEVALDRYLSVCSAIQTYYIYPTASVTAPDALSACVAGELASTDSYNIKINRSRALIAQTRNSLAVLTPIHALPPGILAHVFDLVVGILCDLKVDGVMPTSLPKYPEISLLTFAPTGVISQSICRPFGPTLTLSICTRVLQGLRIERLYLPQGPETSRQPFACEYQPITIEPMAG